MPRRWSNREQPRRQVAACELLQEQLRAQWERWMTDYRVAQLEAQLRRGHR